MWDDLLSTAEECGTFDDFRALVAWRDLVPQVYAWERSSPENERRFQFVGWFGIARAFWDEERGRFALLAEPASMPAPISFENNTAQQTVLLSGLDAMPGQENLFDDVDKQE